MRPFPLGPLKAGITRLRVKGGASAQSLYDLQNGYVAIDGSVLPRPGTDLDTILPAGTKGLTAFDGKLHVFASAPVVMTDPDYVCHVLVHPVTPATALARIHFAEPMLGFLYVVAEFANGDVYHYWLQDAVTWAATTIFAFGALAQPTVPNGYVYSPTNLNTAPVWQGATVHALNDLVQASSYLPFTFKATATTGTPIMTGDTEPTWPTTDGATVVERRYLTNTSTTVPPPPSSPPTAPPPPPVGPSDPIRSRYPSQFEKKAL